MVAGHTKFAPDRLFALTAKAFYLSDILILMKRSSSRRWKTMLVLPLTVVVLSVAGGTVSQKYTNLPGIRELHDFLSLKNPGTDAVMKIRGKCYSGALKNTPMKLSKGINPMDSYQVLIYPMLLKDW